MLDSETILDEMISRIREKMNPDRVILFGSRARGNARPDSDFDLLLIQDSNLPRHRRSAPVYSLLADLPVEVEVMVYTPQEVREWSNVPEAFITTALREGKVLYERTSGSCPRLGPKG